jgi:hypothetical protein
MYRGYSLPTSRDRQAKPVFSETASVGQDHHGRAGAVRGRRQVTESRARGQRLRLCLGQIRSNSVTGPAKVYSAGEGLLRTARQYPQISENASDTEPASCSPSSWPTMGRS